MFKVASLNGNGENQTLLSMNNLVEGNIHGGIINNTTGTKQNVIFLVGTAEFPFNVESNSTTTVSKINVPSSTTVQVNAPTGVNVSVSYIETASDAGSALTTVQELVNEANTSATNAGISETNANNSATNANLSAESANESKTNAGNSEIMASKWAENPEDEEVLTGQYSAYHWARKSQAVASGDVIDDTVVSDLLTWSSIKINNLDVANVKLSGDQTIAGVKTFSSSPIVPTPTTDTEVANKSYVDLKVALTEFTGTNQSKTTNGYQKLPGGLILQWGRTASVPTDGRITVTFPLSFPSSCFAVVCNYQGEASIVVHTASYGVANITKNNFQIENQQIATAAKSFPAVWFAIGY